MNQSGGASDNFENMITDNTVKILNGVSQGNGSYTIGPINFGYPDGTYNGKNKFSWIKDMEAVSDVGGLSISITTTAGESISLSELAENGTKTLNGKDFYMTFYTTEATQVGLKVDFEYISYCIADMTQYNGTKTYLNWKKEVNGRHPHEEKESYDPPLFYRDENNELVEMLKNVTRLYKMRRYKLVKEPGSVLQPLMGLSGTAVKVRKTVTKYFIVEIPKPIPIETEDPEPPNPPDPPVPPPPPPPPKPPIPGDLTMDLGGYVFLDQDSGKINEGNNKLDAGEGVPGTEVYLHEVGKGVVAKTRTNSEGKYSFRHLNSQKKYFVEFVYNGMLYTNVERLPGNAINISKATEEAQGHAGNRQAFNNKFKEIGSNPHNYMSQSRGAYNQVFLQEEIADTFKTIAKNYGAHGNSDKEVYAYDNRIHAYSTEIYPLNNSFTPDSNKGNIGGSDYDALYFDQYDQTHINLGIKARPTFDLTLSKDIMKATLNINGQQEVYTYDARKDWNNQGFSYGVREDYYLNELRNKYILNKSTNIKTTETIDEGIYSHEYRTEEIINGNNENETYRNDWLGKEEYKTTLYGDQSNKNYAWRDINSQLSDKEKLQIHVTYKIGIRNQSSVVGSVTEIVDYFDENYNFESAYMGDKNGNVIPGTTVEVSQTSMYGEATRMGANGKWTVGQEKRGYKTLYLRPTEKILYGDDKDQYIYITFGLINPEETLIRAGLPDGKTFYTYNLAEINGYKTYVTNTDYKENLQYYNTHKEQLENRTLGLVDRDSNPGNYNPATYTMGVTPLEDDTSKAPAYAYSIRTSRTIEGHVFEDRNIGTATLKKHEVSVEKTRFGDGNIDIGDKKDKGIAGVKVELIEIKEQVNAQGQKEEKLVVRSTTYTDKEGWYGFGAFIPGKYTIRFTYGADDQTALTKESQYIKDENGNLGYITQYKEDFKKENGKDFYERYLLDYNIINDTSYNGQDYQATSFADATRNGESTQITLNPQSYKTDEILKQKYEKDNTVAKQKEEQVDRINQTPQTTIIKKYYKQDKQENGEWKETPYYWFEDQDSSMVGKSDAQDDVVRRNQVIAYAKSEYGKEIINHKAEVFNSYINQETLRDAESKDDEFEEFTQAQPMEKVVDTKNKNRSLVDELERRNYMYAYTPEINVEIENTKQQIPGNQNPIGKKEGKDYYEYQITGVDFGMVERPRSQLTINQDIAKIKVTASDGSTILELENENGTGKIKVIVDNGKNYQWLEAGIAGKYDKNELLNVILDDELLSGSKLEVTYKITVSNNSEVDANTQTRAKTIINYVANNLNFDLKDNGDLWEVVKKQEIQTDSRSTWINNENANSKTKQIDLSTQTTVLKASSTNPLTKPLAPGKSVTTTLTLKKTLSAESAADDLSYSNLSEIVEIDNTIGRYDHGAIPGNQSLTEQPREHDTSGSSRYDEIDEVAKTKNVKTRYPQDGKIIITPPTGETKIYYVLGTIVGAILLVGIVLIRKLVVGKNNSKEE